MKLISHFHLVPESQIRGDLTPVPLYASMEWYLCTGAHASVRFLEQFQDQPLNMLVPNFITLCFF